MQDENKTKGKKKAGMTPAGKFLNVLGTFIMCFTILICLAIIAPKVAGINPYIIISGSMEPTIPVGSVVYAKEEDPATLVPGDIIVFYTSNGGTGDAQSITKTPVTHRVTENDPGRGELITKGDANSDRDISPVAYINVLGRVVFHIRGLGYPASMLSTAAGKLAAAFLILAGYLLTEIAVRLGGKDSEE